MARAKKKQPCDCRLILNDMIELLDVNASSVGKRIEFFNRITIPVKNDIIFSEDDKNKLTRAFLQCESVDVCGFDSFIIKKREILYQQFKNYLPDFSLAGIFRADIILTPTDEIMQVYGKEKLHYDIALVSFLDALYAAGNKEIFMRWLLFLSCFPLEESNDTYNYIERIIGRVRDILKSDKQIRLNEALDHFIAQRLETGKKLLNVNICANHGLRWFNQKSRYQALSKIVKQAEHVNIVITEHTVSEYVTKHIREPKEVYDSEFTPSTEKWIRFCSSHKDKVTLKISPIPAMRQYIEFQFEDDEFSAIFAGFYTYGGRSFDDALYMVLRKRDTLFDLYQYEFRYLLGLDSTALNVSDMKHPTEKAVEIADKIGKLDAVDQQLVLDMINRLA